MTFLESYYLLLITLWCGLYLIFYLLYRRSIISLSDPINIGAALLAAYLAGALLILWVMPVNRSYIDLIILIFIYIGVGSIFSRSRQPASVPHLIMEPTTQLLFTIALAGLTIINLFLNEIPRLSYGFRVNAAVALPSLSLIAPDLSFLLLLLFLLSEVMQVRRIAGVGLAFVFLGSLISGSKLGLFSIVFALFVADYILHLKIKSYQLSSNQLLTLKRKIKRIRKAATLCALGAVVALPAYLVMIGVISGAEFGSAISTMTARTFGGLMRSPSSHPGM